MIGFNKTWFISGMDKPHRCPKCWGCHRHGNWSIGWLRRLRWWFPRRCPHCNAVTVTRYLRRTYGSNII